MVLLIYVYVNLFIYNLLMFNYDQWEKLVVQFILNASHQYLDSNITDIVTKY